MEAVSSDLTIYGDKKSGNCYKLQLTCALLNISYQWVDVNIMANECQSPSFKKLNPNEKIPLLLLGNGQTISESNAIINFLAAGSKLLPSDSFMLAKVQQWQFFEQYSHEPYIAVARFINKYLGLPKDRKAEYEAKQVGGHKALQVMEEQLKVSQYLAGDQLTVADISLYAYTHVAPEGGVLLDDYKHIGEWMRRIENNSAYVSMD
jgi:glutathione S-transferase